MKNPKTKNEKFKNKKWKIQKLKIKNLKLIGGAQQCVKVKNPKIKF